MERAERIDQDFSEADLWMACEKFVARDGGGAALHDDQASGDVGEMRSLKRRCAGSKSESVGGENGVTRASNVNGLVAAVNRNERWAIGRLEKEPCHRGRE